MVYIIDKFSLIALNHVKKVVRYATFSSYSICFMTDDAVKETWRHPTIYLRKQEIDH